MANAGCEGTLSDNQMPASEFEVEKATKEIFDKVTSKTKRQTCPYCDNTNWFIFNVSKDQPTLMVSNLGGFQVYALSCTNCEFVRQHIKMVLDGEIVGETDFSTTEEQSDGK